jgi:gentisate 1,2-dioxygenase
VRRSTGAADPFDDVIMEYVDPATGGPVVPALGCYLQMLRPGIRTRAHRETSSAVYHVVAGAGVTTIDGVRHTWGEGDFFAIPPRALHAHANENSTPAILYSVQDVPLLKGLGFYRAEA